MPRGSPTRTERPNSVRLAHHANDERGSPAPDFNCGGCLLNRPRMKVSVRCTIKPSFTTIRHHPPFTTTMPI